jgi:hypothetical protein
MSETTWDKPRGYPFRGGGYETATVSPRSPDDQAAGARSRDDSVMNPDQDDAGKWPSGNAATRRRKRRKYLNNKVKPKGKGARSNPMTAVNGESAAPNFPESYLEREGI